MEVVIKAFSVVLMKSYKDNKKTHAATDSFQNDEALVVKCNNKIAKNMLYIILIITSAIEINKNYYD